MCNNPTNSISIVQLIFPLTNATSSILNMLFLLRHWQYFDENDQEILRTIVLFLLFLGYAMSAFIAQIFIHDLIHSIRLRIVFIVMSVFGLVKVYSFMYQKCEIFGPRLRTTQYKFAVVNYSIQLFTFLFNYSMQYIIYLPIYKLAVQMSIIDTITIFLSTLVVIISAILILLKGICLTCLEQEDDHWFKRVFFLGQCCCDLFEAHTTRKYVDDREQDEASWSTDYA